MIVRKHVQVGLEQDKPEVEAVASDFGSQCFPKVDRVVHPAEAELCNHASVEYFCGRNPTATGQDTG